MGVASNILHDSHIDELTRKATIARVDSQHVCCFNILLDVPPAIGFGDRVMRAAVETKVSQGGIFQLPASEFLRRKMAIAGLTATELARDMGIHAQTLYNVTAGKRPISPSLALKLSKRFVESADVWLSDPITVTAEQMLDLAVAESGAQADSGSDSDKASLIVPSTPDLTSVTVRTLFDFELKALEQSGSGIQIDPFNQRCVQPASYDLTVGLIIEEGVNVLSQHEWSLIMRSEHGEALDAREAERVKRVVEQAGQKIKYTTNEAILKPGQDVSIITRERLKFGNNFFALVGSTAVNARNKLMVCYGAQVDPGYDEHLYLSAFNFGRSPLPLASGDKILTLTICWRSIPPLNAYQDEVNHTIIEILNDIDRALGRHLRVREDLNTRGWIAQGEAFRGSIHAETKEEVVNRALQFIFEGLDGPSTAERYELARVAIEAALASVWVSLPQVSALYSRLRLENPDAMSQARGLFVGEGRSMQELGDVLKVLGVNAISAVLSLRESL